MSERAVEVAIGVVVDAQPSGPRVLISRRREQDVLGGFWEFPGGKVEPEETLEQCLIREFREELAVEIAVEESLEPIEHTYPHARVRLSPFFCRWLAGEPQALESSEVRWVEVADLAGYEFPPANLGLLEAVTLRYGRQSPCTG